MPCSMLLIVTVTLLPGLMAVTMPDDSYHCEKLSQCKSLLEIPLPEDFDGRLSVSQFADICRRETEFYNCSNWHSRFCYNKCLKDQSEVEVATTAYKCLSQGLTDYGTMLDTECFNDFGRLKDMLSKLSDCSGTFRKRVADLEASRVTVVSTFCSLVQDLTSCANHITNSCQGHLRTNYAYRLYNIQASFQFKELKCPEVEKSVCWSLSWCLSQWKLPSFEPTEFGLTWFFSSEKEIDYLCLDVRPQLLHCTEGHLRMCHKHTFIHYRMQTKKAFLEAICDEPGKSSLKQMLERSSSFMTGVARVLEICTDPLVFTETRSGARHRHYDPPVCVQFSQQLYCQSSKMTNYFHEQELQEEFTLFNRIAPFLLSEHLYSYDNECKLRDKCKDLLACEWQFIIRNYSSDSLDYELNIPPEPDLVNLCSNFSKLIQCWEKHSNSCISKLTRQQVWDTMKWVKSVCFTNTADEGTRDVGSENTKDCTVLKAKNKFLTCTFPNWRECPLQAPATTVYWFASDSFTVVARCNATLCTSDDSRYFSARIFRSNETHLTSELRLRTVSRSVPFDMATAWSCMYSRCDATVSMKKLAVCSKLNLTMITDPCWAIRDCFNKPLERKIRPGDISAKLMTEFSEKELRALCQIKKELGDCVNKNADKCWALDESLGKSLLTDMRLVEYFCTDGGNTLFSEMSKTKCVKQMPHQHGGLGESDSLATSWGFNASEFLEPNKLGCLCTKQ